MYWFSRSCPLPQNSQKFYVEFDGDEFFAIRQSSTFDLEKEKGICRGNIFVHMINEFTHS